MKAQKKQPELRFKGFTDDWEQVKLESITTIHARIGWQNLRTSEFLDSGEYMLITGTDFKNGEIDYSNIHYVEQERYEQDEKIQIEDGSILITKDGTLGKVAYVKELPAPATLNAGVFNVKVNKNVEVNPKYLFHYLYAPFLLKFASEQSTGGTIKHLNQNVLVKFSVPLTSFEEQSKISDFLTKFDQAITLQQRRLDLLKKLKQGYLQQMFPNKEHPTPQLRFTSFDGDWEHHKLGEVANRFDNLRLPITASKRVSGDTPYYGANGIQDHVKGYTHNGEFILVAEDGASNLNNYPIQYTTGKIWVNNHAHVLQGKENEVDTRFLMHSLKKVKINSFLVGGGRAKLNADIMMKLEINIPLENEQKQISKFFQNIDQAITLEKNKIEQLQQLKQAYLQKLFP